MLKKLMQVCWAKNKAIVLIRNYRLFSCILFVIYMCQNFGFFVFYKLQNFLFFIRYKLQKLDNTCSSKLLESKQKFFNNKKVNSNRMV